MNVHFSSATDDWATPQALFDEWDAKCGPLEIDVCASEQNAKCRRFFTKEQNGLAQSWAPHRCWMNPPYGRTIGFWMRKAYEEARLGATVVCLVPARTDTAWWHEYAKHGDIHFIRGRVKFGSAKHSAPFPSAVVVFKPFLYSVE